MKSSYNGIERRQFLRMDYTAPLAYKVCRRKIIAKLFQGYTLNISQSGLLCKIKDKVNIGDILWVSFDKNTLLICEDLERRSLIYQNGIIGKVIRIGKNKDNTFSVGIKFMTQEEKNLTNIYPKIYFLQKHNKVPGALKSK